MTPPNDMPADTELRQDIDHIFLSNYTALHDDFWKSEFEAAKGAAEELMQLIKARDAAIRIDEATYIREHADDSIISDAWPAYAEWLDNRIAELSTPTDQKEKE